jgi:thymidylate synthase ThyX
MTAIEYFREPFTDHEAALLGRFFTNTTEPVFGLVNLPEVVKGALFARYSRSPKSLRRLFLDEFASPDSGFEAVAVAIGDPAEAVQLARAEELYTRVFTQYGDDSVAQLGAMHLACEQSSNVLTKVLEWGRLAAYLEQSTRYMFYDEPLGARFRYAVPPEVGGSPLESDFRNTLDSLFTLYGTLTRRSTAYYESLFPKQPGDSGFVYRSTIRARVCDDLRGLLPAATISNVGIHGSGQAFEMLLLRMRAHPLAEVRAYSDLMLTELRKMAPAFLRRVDVPDRGGEWSGYLEATAAAMHRLGAEFVGPIPDRPEVTLVEWDPDAELKVAAAALYSVTGLPDDVLLDRVRSLPVVERVRLIEAYVGLRANRRHKPGRAFERTGYRFDILCDYGIFRDLQRHRLLTLEWQRLDTRHGYVVPPAIAELGEADRWTEAMESTAALATRLDATFGPEVAQYAIPFAYRIRFVMQLNAREAMHLIELRTAPGGHPGYRRVCQEMHRLIRDEAGHHTIADAMRFVDRGETELGRLDGERRAAARRSAAGVADPVD